MGAQPLVDHLPPCNACRAHAQFANLVGSAGCQDGQVGHLQDKPVRLVQLDCLAVAEFDAGVGSEVRDQGVQLGGRELRGESANSQQRDDNVCLSVCLLGPAQALTLPSMISQRLAGLALPVELRRASSLGSRPSCHSLRP